jgi:hypothetical protein
MPFSKEFVPRWESVFVPAIAALKLDPYRVDARRVSDSIVTDILQGIASARLVLVDVSADQAGIRNGNVMYELGLAHATRLPEEVVVVRCDDEPLLFDVAQVRVTSFSPGEADASRELIAGLLREALRETDLKRDLLVQRTVAQLDAPCIDLMVANIGNEVFDHPEVRTVRDAVGGMEMRRATVKLLEAGLFEAFLEMEQQRIRYRWTSFGRAVLGRLVAQVIEHREAAE